MPQSPSDVRRRARGLLALAALVTLTLPRAAHAQTSADRDQHVVFDDDLLNADLDAPFGDPIFATHLPPARTQLIRPRTNFLPELYKSVEHL